MNEKIEILGYIHLYLKLWPVSEPDECYYMEQRFDFTKPLSEEAFVVLLDSAKEICETQNNGREFDGKYISKREYENATANDNDFATVKFGFGNTDELPGLKMMQ